MTCNYVIRLRATLPDCIFPLQNFEVQSGLDNDKCSNFHGAPGNVSRCIRGPRHPVWETLLHIFTRGHLFIEASHRTSFRIFDNSLLRDIFPENYKKIIILLYTGPPKRPDTFKNLIEIKRVDENN